MSRWSAFWSRTSSRRATPAESHAAGPITADDVAGVRFSKPPLGQRGYSEEEVDDFLDLVAAGLRGDPRAAGLTPSDIHNVAFPKPPIGMRGYDEDEVDAFLDACEAELGRRRRPQ